MAAAPPLAIIDAKNLWGVANPSATSLLCVDGAIRVVGTREDVLAAAAAAAGDGAFRTIDCRGTLTVYPGFIDSHVHFTDSGRRLVGRRHVHLRKAPGGRPEIVGRIRAHIAAHALRPGEWIVGGEWNENDWAALAGDGAEAGEVHRISREWLDEASTEHPMLLARYDLHSVVCNSLALRLAGIDASTPDPVGGAIERVDGAPTGVLRERAIRLVKDIWPRCDTLESLDAACDAAQRFLLRRGVTTCATMTSLDFDNVHEISHLEAMEREGRLKMRVRCAVRVSEMDELRALVRRTPTLRRGIAGSSSGAGPLPRVLVGPVKIFADGSLGSRTCCMKHRFADRDSRGMLLSPREELHRDVQHVIAASIADPASEAEGEEADVDIRWQCCVHAIGDQAASEVIAAAEALVAGGAATVQQVRSARFRIEHCQIVTNPDDIRRLAAIGGIGSVQPLQLVYDGPTAFAALGSERANRDTYPLASLMRAGVRLCGGSDWMVVQPDVGLGVTAAVTRLALAPHDAAEEWFEWQPDEAVTLEDAVAHYTTDAAFGNCCEHALGQLACGFAADVAILEESLDQTVTKARQQRNGLLADGSTTVMYTIVAGEVVYERDAS